MADDWAERRTALDDGSAYSVLREASSWPKGSDFEVGEVVRLRHVGYSRYDSSHAYTFDAKDGREKTYWLHDDQPLELLTNTFERYAPLGHERK